MDVNKETGEITVLPALPASALEAQTRGEIDIQVVTAKRYPRSITKFRQEIGSLALLDQETAEACIYALPRDGKSVEGPSARFAEIIASSWGHMRVESRVTGEDDHFVTVRGTAWDLERNVAKAVEVRRRITNKTGRRFTDDMIVVTSNAAGSIASRNAILQVVPRAYWYPTYEACRKAAVGDQKTLADRRAKALAYFQKMGIAAERVFALLGVAGEDDINSEHVLRLLGLATAIKEGDTNIDEAFPSQGGAHVVSMPQRRSETAKAADAAAQPSSPAVGTADPSATSDPAQTSGSPAPDQQQAPGAATTDAAPAPAPTTPAAPTAQETLPKPLAYHGQSLRILRVWQPDPNKAGRYVETTEGLAHANRPEAVRALEAAATSNAVMKLTGAQTAYPPAPFQIHGVTLDLPATVKAAAPPSMPAAGDLDFGSGRARREREPGEDDQ